MENILTGFFKGFGGTFGVVMALATAVIIIKIIIDIKDSKESRKNMPRMLLEYRKYLKKH